MFWTPGYLCRDKNKGHSQITASSSLVAYAKLTIKGSFYHNSKGLP